MTLAKTNKFLVKLLPLALAACFFLWPGSVLAGRELPLAPCQGRQAADYIPGQDLPPELLAGAESLSARQELQLEDSIYLFFSNVPEFPTEAGLLCRVEDVLSPSGKVRVFLSHMNLLIDWKSRPVKNLPAAVGFCVENRTSRTLDVYAERGALEINRDAAGRPLFYEDAAPVPPGRSEPQYYGSAVGNYTVAQWFRSANEQPVLLGRTPPGGRVTVSRVVGPRGWITGIYDLIFVDAATGRQLGSGDLAPGERVGLKTFLAPAGANLNTFLNRSKPLPPRSNDLAHMRGLFRPGSYPDNPRGEAVSKKFTVDYDAGSGKAASFALAAGEYDQGEDPKAPGYVADIFLNDRMRNGFDPYGNGKKGVNGGNYGVDYTVELNLRGPAALAVQGAVQPGISSVDLYNQILTVWLDDRVSTIMIRDPNYEKFYTDFNALRPQGYGRVLAVFREEGNHKHVLRFTLPPNGYGPVRFYLLPKSCEEVDPQRQEL